MTALLALAGLCALAGILSWRLGEWADQRRRGADSMSISEAVYMIVFGLAGIAVTLAFTLFVIVLFNLVLAIVEVIW